MCLNFICFKLLSISQRALIGRPRERTELKTLESVQTILEGESNVVPFSPRSPIAQRDVRSPASSLSFKSTSRPFQNKPKSVRSETFTTKMGVEEPSDYNFVPYCQSACVFLSTALVLSLVYYSPVVSIYLYVAVAPEGRFKNI